MLALLQGYRLCAGVVFNFKASEGLGQFLFKFTLPRMHFFPKELRPLINGVSYISQTATLQTCLDHALVGKEHTSMLTSVDVHGPLPGARYQLRSIWEHRAREIVLDRGDLRCLIHLDTWLKSKRRMLHCIALAHLVLAAVRALPT